MPAVVLCLQLASVQQKAKYFKKEEGGEKRCCERRLPCKGAELGPGPACSGGMQRAWLWTSASSWWPPTPALKGLMSVHRAPHSPVGTWVLRREDLARSTPVPLHTGTGGGRRGRAWAVLASACTSTLPVLPCWQNNCGVFLLHPNSDWKVVLECLEHCAQNPVGMRGCQLGRCWVNAWEASRDSRLDNSKANWSKWQGPLEGGRAASQMLCLQLYFCAGKYTGVNVNHCLEIPVHILPAGDIFICSLFIWDRNARKKSPICFLQLHKHYLSVTSAVCQWAVCPQSSSKAFRAVVLPSKCSVLGLVLQSMVCLELEPGEHSVPGCRASLSLSLAASWKEQGLGMCKGRALQHSNHLCVLQGWTGVEAKAGLDAPARRGWKAAAVGLGEAVTSQKLSSWIIWEISFQTAHIDGEL